MSDDWGPNAEAGWKEVDKLRGQLATAQAKIMWQSQHICDECTNSEGEPTGWCENRVEGRYPCICITESEPYQELLTQLADIKKAAEAYEADPVNAYDKMSSWEKLDRLVKLAKGDKIPGENA